MDDAKSLWKEIKRLTWIRFNCPKYNDYYAQEIDKLYEKYNKVAPKLDGDVKPVVWSDEMDRLNDLDFNPINDAEYDFFKDPTLDNPQDFVLQKYEYLKKLKRRLYFEIKSTKTYNRLIVFIDYVYWRCDKHYEAWIGVQKAAKVIGFDRHTIGQYIQILCDKKILDCTEWYSYGKPDLKSNHPRKFRWWDQP